MREHSGVTKFEPPERPADGDALPAVAAFHRYTEIENIRNFPDVLRPGEQVVITEKLLGKNCRLGRVRIRTRLHKIIPFIHSTWMSLIPRFFHRLSARAGNWFSCPLSTVRH